MRARRLAFARLLAGAGLTSIVACAQSENTTPFEELAGSSASIGGKTSGSGGSASVAGAAVVAGAPAGGAPVAAAGTSAGGSGAAGAPITGSAGSAPTSGCKAATGALTDLAIDDLEDGENAIQALGQRVGYWYTYNDKTGTQIPAPDLSGAIPFKSAMGGHPCSLTTCAAAASELFSAKTTGMGFTTWGAGMGFDFNNTASKSCPYNASAYTGIKFWAKGNVTLKAMVTIPATTQQSPANSGTCTTAAMCEDHYALTPKPALTATWTQYTIDFSSATTFAQEGWGVKVPFAKNGILAVQFQVPASTTFDFSVDDVTFY